MAYLIDTSILARMANNADIDHATANRSLLKLHRQGETIHITSQNLVEFRNMATRPAIHNGLGMTPAETEAKSSAFESYFPLLEETPDIFPAWKALVTGLRVIGKQVHDARLVAVCHVQGVTHILTFNTGHFARLSDFGPGIMVVDPAKV